MKVFLNICFILVLFVLNTMLILNISATSANNGIESYENAYFAFEPTNKPKFTSFDINSNGMIAIALNDEDFKGVLVYNEKGDFEYALRIESYGNIQVKWHNNQLGIYYVRGDDLVIYDRNAVCIDVIKNADYDNTYALADKYFNGIKYTAKFKDNLFEKFAYNQDELFKISEDGREILIYQSNKSRFTKDNIIGFILIITAIVVVTFYTIKCRRIYKKENS